MGERGKLGVKERRKFLEKEVEAETAENICSVEEV